MHCIIILVQPVQSGTQAFRQSTSISVEEPDRETTDMCFRSRLADILSLRCPD